MVAPFTGAWIETDLYGYVTRAFNVAPFTGAWIETIIRKPKARRAKSLPSRERGLKQKLELINGLKSDVAPFTGAWIETNPVLF